MKVNVGLLFILFPLLISCEQDVPNRQAPANPTLVGSGLEVQDAWARPAAEGLPSAVYFTLVNYDEVSATITGVASSRAQLAEIHESYEREPGLMGMRKIEELTIPGQSTLPFERGGLHVMLLNVQPELAEGDAFTLSLHLAGRDTLRIPVQVRR
ncbi:MAG: copper chaperone PCu(A)C [Balneolaceae bacterium]